MNDPAFDKFKVGQKCLARPSGIWESATIHRINVDGSCDIQFDVQDSPLMPYWYNVTRAELSLDDEGLWQRWIQDRRNGNERFAKSDFLQLLDLLGYIVEDPRVGAFWADQCAEQFGFGDAENCELDAEQTYQLLRVLGNSARAICDQSIDAHRLRYNKLWWNQTRQGGRQPEEVARAVTVDDAYRALAIEFSPDAEVPDTLEGLQTEWQVQVPKSLVQMYSQPGIEPAIRCCHPNNPNLLTPAPENLLDYPSIKNASFEFAILFMEHGRYDYSWAVVFDRDGDETPVYLRGPEGWYPTAPSLEFFLWDLAQIGLCWEQSIEEEYLAKGKSFEQKRSAFATDIGWALR